MNDVSQFRAPSPIVVQQPRSPWSNVFPELVGNIVGNAIMDKIRAGLQQRQQQAQFQQEKTLQGMRGQQAMDIEKARENAEAGRANLQDITRLMLAGYRLGADGNWLPPQQGVASGVSSPVGYTPVFENGKLRFVQTRPKVTVNIGGQDIPDVDPNTAASVAGHVYGQRPQGQFTTNEVIGQTNKYWDNQARLVDKQYGMTDSRGNLIIDPGKKDQWLAARKNIENQRLQDLYGIAGGKKPSWMTTKPPDQAAKDFENSQVKSFIQTFGGGQ